MRDQKTSHDLSGCACVAMVAMVMMHIVMVTVIIFLFLSECTGCFVKGRVFMASCTENGDRVSARVLTHLPFINLYFLLPSELWRGRCCLRQWILCRTFALIALWSEWQSEGLLFIYWCCLLHGIVVESVCSCRCWLRPSMAGGACGGRNAGAGSWTQWYVGILFSAIALSGF